MGTVAPSNILAQPRVGHPILLCNNTPQRIPFDADKVPFPTPTSVLLPGSHIEDSSPLISHRYPLCSYLCCSSLEYITESKITPQANAVLNTHRQHSRVQTLVLGPNKRIWIQVLTNNLGRLAQGVGTRMPKGTNTIFSIKRTAIPKERKIHTFD